jgi:hypothetical protein
MLILGCKILTHKSSDQFILLGLLVWGIKSYNLWYWDIQFYDETCQIYLWYWDFELVICEIDSGTCNCEIGSDT